MLLGNLIIRPKIRLTVYRQNTVLGLGWGLSSLGSDQPILDSEFCLGGVDPPCGQAGLPKMVSLHP